MVSSSIGHLVSGAFWLGSILAAWYLMPESGLAAGGRGLHIIAHRGNGNGAPENSVAALRRAGDHADIVELDVQLSSDGVPVVIHDSTVDRTTHRTGRVDALTAGELRALAIPTLSETLSALEDRTNVLVDLKHVAPGKAIQLVEACVRDIDRAGVRARCSFQTIHPENLVALEQRAAGVPYSLLAGTAGDIQLAVALAFAVRASGLNTTLNGLDQGSVSMAHALGMKVYVYTLNTEREFRQALECGVDGIITDRPAELKKFLRAASATRS